MSLVVDVVRTMGVFLTRSKRPSGPPTNRQAKATAKRSNDMRKNKVKLCLRSMNSARPSAQAPRLPRGGRISGGSVEQFMHDQRPFPWLALGSRQRGWTANLVSRQQVPCVSRSESNADEQARKGWKRTFLGPEVVKIDEAL